MLGSWEKKEIYPGGDSAQVGLNSVFDFGTNKMNGSEETKTQRKERETRPTLRTATVLHPESTALFCTSLTVGPV